MEILMDDTQRRFLCLQEQRNSRMIALGRKEMELKEKYFLRVFLESLPEEGNGYQISGNICFMQYFEWRSISPTTFRIT